MKKSFFALLIGLLLVTSVFADHTGTGIGAIFGGGYNRGIGGHFYPGFSLKLPSIPIFWGFHSYISGDSFGLGVTGDAYLFEWNMVNKKVTNDDGSYYNVKIDWYLGMGFIIDMHFWAEHDEGSVSGDLGFRVPFGVSWHVVKKFEAAAGIAPGFGWFGRNKVSDFLFVFPLEVALRFWFT